MKKINIIVITLVLILFCGLFNTDMVKAEQVDTSDFKKVTDDIDGYHYERLDFIGVNMCHYFGDIDGNVYDDLYDKNAIYPKYQLRNGYFWYSDGTRYMENGTEKLNGCEVQFSANKIKPVIKWLEKVKKKRVTDTWHYVENEDGVLLKKPYENIVFVQYTCLTKNKESIINRGDEVYKQYGTERCYQLSKKDYKKLIKKLDKLRAIAEKY